MQTVGVDEDSGFVEWKRKDFRDSIHQLARKIFRDPYFIKIIYENTNWDIIMDNIMDVLFNKTDLRGHKKIRRIVSDIKNRQYEKLADKLINFQNNDKGSSVYDKMLNGDALPEAIILRIIHNPKGISERQESLFLKLLDNLKAKELYNEKTINKVSKSFR